ncbi:MAG: dihydrofolate reductase [Alphaproteobacteria bacterium PA3]|nr:MAG: dihydrofolate reductase [Alphaproteobacteria bacterium PA3]
MKSIKLCLVVARGRNHVIGVDNDLPWRLGSDLKNFKAITLGKPVIMGRKTWDSIGRPLPGRPNLVITRDTNFQAQGASVWTSLPLAIEAAKAMAKTTQQAEICVIGGGQIYAEALPFADRLYLTEVDAAPKGTAFFPAFDEAEWTQTAHRAFTAGAKDDHDFVVRVLDRKA